MADNEDVGPPTDLQQSVSSTEEQEMGARKGESKNQDSEKVG